MKIYVITKGYYSAYHICGVADNKKDALILKKFFSSDDMFNDEANIEEYDTDSFSTHVRMGCKIYACRIYDDGTYTINTTDPDYVEECDFNVRYFKNFHFLYVWGKDEEHAKKIAFDKVAQYKAKKKGIS